MKKTIFLTITAIICILSLSVTAFAHKSELHWGCKRCGNNQPPLTEAERLIAKYGGYSIDRSVDDSSDKKVLYLTFDLGYDNGNTAKILDTLSNENVPAAFFILDNIVLRNADLVTKMNSAGHLVCNHTKDHKNVCRMTADEIADNLCTLEKLCLDKTGITMAKYFRFPEGRYNEEALKTINNLGYKSIFWSFAYADWDNDRQPAPEVAIKKVLDNTHNGAVILLHPTSSTNAEILPTLIKEWRAQGYTFSTLDDLTAVK